MGKLFNEKYKNFAQIMRNLKNNYNQNLAQKFSSIKVYIALAVPILLYGSEIWALR